MIAALIFTFPLSAAEPPLVVAKTLPAWFPAQLFSPDDVQAENYNEWGFFVRHSTPRDPQNYDKVTVRGRYWEARLPPKDRPHWTAQGFPGWNDSEKRLAEAGFREVYRHESEDRHVVNGLELTFQRGEGESATYLRVALSADDTSRNKMNAIQVATNPLAIELKPPAATPESVTDKGDYPYLPPPPGVKLIRTVHRDEPMHYLEGKDTATLVGTGFSSKEYESDPTISPLAFHDAYIAAFRKAGWTVTSDFEGQGMVYARYGRNGRDISARVKHDELGIFEIEVADAGSELKAKLAKDCKAALYGVNFDFDKATLRPDSEPALAQVANLMKEEPGLVLEIGGHTDNVGKPDYNMGLSDRRAASVKEWLVARGIPVARLTTRGYGDTQPILPNTSDENRARNRRVELKKPGCK